MSKLGWHACISLADRRPLCPGPAEQRAFARTLLGIGRDCGLVLFNGSDDHGHIVAEGVDRPRFGRLVRDVETALRRRLDLPIPFRNAHIVAVEDHRHMRRLVAYVLGNARKHGTAIDPFFEATNLPDLLGLRVTGTYTATNLRRVCPRLQRRDLLEVLGVCELRPGTTLARLVESAAAALALPGIDGNQGEAVAARRAAVRIGQELGLRPAAIASLLDVKRRSVHRLLGQSVPENVVRAVRLQMGLREAVGSSGPRAAPVPDATNQPDAPSRDRTPRSQAENP